MKKSILGLGIIVGLGVVSLFFFKPAMKNQTAVRSSSMEPTLKPGDSIEIDGDAYLHSEPAKEDIVAYVTPVSNETLVLGRLKGLPGEVLTPLQTDGQILQLKENEYYIRGDNKEQSRADSRYIGPISRDQIKGKVKLIDGHNSKSP